MPSDSECAEVEAAREIVERLNAVWTGGPNSHIRTFSSHASPKRTYAAWVASEMDWGHWWSLPLFRYGPGTICLPFSATAAATFDNCAVVDACENQGNVQCTHIRHYLKRSYLNSAMYPLHPNAWRELRADWADRKPSLVDIHQALGNTDSLEELEALLFDDAMFPPEFSSAESEQPSRIGRIGQCLARLDPAPTTARVGPMAVSVASGGEPDLDADYGPWRPMVCSMAKDQETFTPRQAWEMALLPGNVDISGQSIHMIRFPNIMNAHSALGKVTNALDLGAQAGHVTLEQREHPLFRALFTRRSGGHLIAARELEAAGEYTLAWNALLTANLYAPLNPKERAWLPLFKQALGVARAGNFRFVPVLEWMWSNYAVHNPEVDRSGT